MANTPHPPTLAGPTLNAVLGGIAFAAIALPSLAVLTAPRIVPHRTVQHGAQRIVPPAELPPVEPVAFEDLAPDDARAFNASVPFVDGPNPPARPFRFTGSADQRARARDCLATAVLYEAGDDTPGERAVAQVVLNRARHPAFPKTVCGVVFQGAERSTGCQFTFTCDGALANHRWSDAAWARAREVADAALSGAVYRPVGYATHYHTDWVVPYWQASLDKIAAVHTHLFFRWTGWWGTPGAFGRHVSPDEPVVAALALWSDAHKTGAALAATDAALAAADAVIADIPPGLRIDPNSFVLKLDPHLAADGYAALAARACGERPYCKVMGWTDQARLPAQLPLQSAQIATMSFSYLRDKAHNFDKALWNCAEFKRTDKTQCMKLQVLTPAPRPADDPRPDDAMSTRRTVSPPPGPAPHRAVAPPSIVPPPQATPTARAIIEGR